MRLQTLAILLPLTCPVACERLAAPPTATTAMPPADASATAPPTPTPTPTIDGHWVLEHQSASPLRPPGNPCYSHTESGGQSSATVVSRLTCGDKPWTGTVSGQWSTPPSTLIPGQPLQMAAAARATASHEGVTASSVLAIRFDRADCGGTSGPPPIVFLQASTHGGMGPTPSGRGEGVVPGRTWSGGAAGLEDRLKLKVCMDRWQAYFIYKWRPGPPASVPDQRAADVPVPAGPDEAPPPTPPTKGIWQEGWKDSGARFSDLSGEVEWRSPDDEEGWHFAKLDQPLPVGAHIRTGEGSSAMFSFSDMTTFVQRPETEIILGDPTQRESLIRMMAGQLWINIRKMLKDGSMDIEMSQAVAGGRGTIFRTDERDGRSEVAVCQGRVAFSHRSNGQVVELGPGDAASADPAGIARSTPGVDSVCRAWTQAGDAPKPPPGP